jgi:hypothetical protein
VADHLNAGTDRPKIKTKLLPPVDRGPFKRLHIINALYFLFLLLVYIQVYIANSDALAAIGFVSFIAGIALHVKLIFQDGDFTDPEEEMKRKEDEEQLYEYMSNIVTEENNRCWEYNMKWSLGGKCKELTLTVY